MDDERPFREVGDPEPEESEQKEELSLNIKFTPPILITVAVAIALVILVFVALTPDMFSSGSAELSDEDIIDVAYTASKNMIELAEVSGEFSINEANATVLTRAPYIVSFPIEGSDIYEELKVELDENFNLMAIGYDGELIEPSAFYAVASVSNAMLAECARAFNEEEVLMNIIQKWYEAPAFTPGKQVELSISRYIQCGPLRFPYELEIGDGFVTTTMINNVSITTDFIRGVVEKGTRIPRDDIAAGVHLRVKRNDVENRTELGTITIGFKPINV